MLQCSSFNDTEEDEKSSTRISRCIYIFVSHSECGQAAIESRDNGKFTPDDDGEE